MVSSKEDMMGDDGDLDKAEMSSLIAAQNKKKKKSGGFQSMGLDNEVPLCKTLPLYKRRKMNRRSTANKPRCDTKKSIL